MDTNKLLRAIWITIKVISVSALAAITSYKIVSFVTLGLINSLNSNIAPIVILSVICFVTLVKAYYELNDE